MAHVDLQAKTHNRQQQNTAAHSAHVGRWAVCMEKVKRCVCTATSHIAALSAAAAGEGAEQQKACHRPCSVSLALLHQQTVSSSQVARLCVCGATAPSTQAPAPQIPHPPCHLESLGEAPLYGCLQHDPQLRGLDHIPEKVTKSRPDVVHLQAKVSLLHKHTQGSIPRKQDSVVSVG